jgi:hypothetical protein
MIDDGPCGVDSRFRGNDCDYRLQITDHGQLTTDY